MGPFTISVFRVGAIYRKVLTMGVRKERAIRCLRLRRIVSNVLTLVRVMEGLIAVRALQRRPSNFARPRRECSVFVLRMASLLKRRRFTILPKGVHFHFLHQRQDETA